MKYIYYTVCLMLLGFGSSCKKDVVEPLPEENLPVFNVEGKLGSQQIVLKAGVDNVYMDTEKSEWNNVSQFMGVLGNKQTSFSIRILEGMLDLPTFESEITDFDAFNVAPYIGNEPLAVFSQQNFINKEYISSIEWSVDGVVQDNSILKIYEPGKYNICATIGFIDGSSGKTCNDMLIGYEKNSHGLIKHMVTQYNKTIAFIDSPNKPIKSVKWYVNDELTSTEENFKMEVESDAFVLGAHVTYESGIYREKEIFINTSHSKYFIEDLTTIENQSSAHWDHTATVEIKLNGKDYIAIPNSSNTSTLQIEDIIPFETNSNGNDVTILKGALNCKFIDISTQEILDGEFSYSFGIAH
ncbi:MAG: hypothetical protein WED10_01385 [Brumimicrobium sp.]